MEVPSKPSSAKVWAAWSRMCWSLASESRGGGTVVDMEFSNVRSTTLVPRSPPVKPALELSVPSKQWQFAAQSLLAGQGVHLGAHRKVPGSYAVGLEKRYLHLFGAAGGFVGNQLSELEDLRPAFLLLEERNDQIAGFLLGLRERIHKNQIGFRYHLVVHFSFVGMVGANCIDMYTGDHVGTPQNGLRRRGGRADD